MSNTPKLQRSTSGLSRRNFLRGAAAMVALPTIVPASVFGADGRPAPSNRIVLAGIGIGSQGNSDQGAFLRNQDVQYVAVADVKEQVRQSCKSKIDRQYGNTDCKVYNDFREVLARSDIDAVHIATPDHWHAVITVAACRAGKDVYCQKPESLTIKEGRAMVENARRYGRVVSGGSQRVMGDYMQTVQTCWGGKNGTPTEAVVSCGPVSSPCYLPGQPVPEGVDWDMWLGPAPWAPYHAYRISGSYSINGTSWRSWRDYSGGGLTDWGAHHFGGAMFAVNKMEEGPVEVIPPSGNERRLTFVFADGFRLYHSTSGQSMRVTAYDGKPVPARTIPRYKAPARDIYSDWINCIRTREKPFRDIERAHRTASICHLGNIGYWLARPLKWDPIKEEFPGDDQANRLLDRARREPWTI